jgi:hypothetical protein
VRHRLVDREREDCRTSEWEVGRRQSIRTRYLALHEDKGSSSYVSRAVSKRTDGVSAAPAHCDGGRLRAVRHVGFGLLRPGALMSPDNEAQESFGSNLPKTRLSRNEACAHWLAQPSCFVKSQSGETKEQICDDGAQYRASDLPPEILSICEVGVRWHEQQRVEEREGRPNGQQHSNPRSGQPGDPRNFHTNDPTVSRA